MMKEEGTKRKRRCYREQGGVYSKEAIICRTAALVSNYKAEP